MNRREFVRSLVTSGVLLGIGLVGVGEMIALAKRGATSNSSSLEMVTSNQQTTSATTGLQTTEQVTSQTTQQTSAAPSGYFFVTALSSLSGKTYAYFNHPTAGSAIILNTGGVWKAFSATCTHRPCTVNYTGSDIYCPCHGATFSPTNGGVTGGPAPSPLPEYGVQIISGSVYVSTTRIN